MKLKQNLDKLIYEQIIDSLILGEYKMGEQILLDTLSEKYGVSRTPVVQAIKLLSNDGVLEILNNGRVRVPTFSPAQIRQICEIRILLELYAIDEAFSALEPESFLQNVEELRDLAEASQRYSTANDILRFNKADLSFHRLLVKSGSNAFLLDLYKRIQGQFVVANYLSHAWTGADFARSACAHLSIMDAYSKRDISTCKQLLSEHIRSVYQVGDWKSGEVIG